MGAKKVFGIFILLSLVYLGLMFGLPNDSSALQRYDLSTGEARALQLSVAAPIILIWLAAFYGYALFQRYADAIRNSNEGKAWSYIAGGLLGLALWLPVNSIINQITSYIYYQNSDATPEAVILQNYINLAIILTSFILLYKGTNMLVRSIKKPLPNKWKNGWLTVLLLESALFAYLTITNDYKSVPVNENTHAAYYLPDWLLILTIVIPYIVVFYLGFQVVQNIYLYRKNVAGKLYKDSLRFLADGIGFVVLSIMVVRYLASLTSVFADATLRLILMILFVLIILIAAGYVMIALGAKRMQKLEEV